MLLVNIYGGPGCGKSTIQAGLFHDLKLAGINVEMMLETAKILHYERRLSSLDSDPLYIPSEKLRYMTAMRDSGEVDVLLMDSPLLQALIYTDLEAMVPSFGRFFYEWASSFNSIDYLIQRKVDYVAAGRLQTQDEASEIDHKITAMLENYNIPFTAIQDPSMGKDIIFKDILSRCASK